MLANQHFLKNDDMVSRSAGDYPCVEAVEKAYNLSFSDPVNDELAQKIISKMPEGAIPIHISIVGSRAKSNMDDSDY